MRFTIWVKIIAAITSVLLCIGVMRIIASQLDVQALPQTSAEATEPCRVAIDIYGSEYLKLKRGLIDHTEHCDYLYAKYSFYSDLLLVDTLSEQQRMIYELDLNKLSPKLKDCEQQINFRIRDSLHHLPSVLLCPNDPPVQMMSSGYLGTDIQDTMVAFNKELYMYFNKTVLVALTAEWCTPCQEYLPELRQFVAQHSDSLALIEIDIERRSITSFLVGGNYLPSIIVYRKLEPIARLEGTAGIAYFESWLRPYFH